MAEETEQPEQEFVPAEDYNRLIEAIESRDEIIRDLTERLQQAQAGQIPRHHIVNPNTISWEPTISREGKPKLVLRWGNLSAEFGIRESITHALLILQVAEAARSDAILYRFFASTMPGSDAMAMINLLRSYREQAVNQEMAEKQ